MDILTPKATRRSTRLRVRLPVTMTSLDRQHTFVAECLALVVSSQGAGLEAPHALPIETPVMLSGLPGGTGASARVASCLPLGPDEKKFLIGISLYNPGNVWGIADPPEDWNVVSTGSSSSSSAPGAMASGSAKGKNKDKSKEVWPYNVFSSTEAHPGRKR